MMKELLILAVIACAVMADNYLCHPKGDPFECFESAPDARFCVKSKRGPAEVICGKCRKKADFCNKSFEESKHPERDCGPHYESTPCTKANSEIPHKY